MSGCADPPIVSADTSCDSYRHISADDTQRKAMADDWTVWESLARQIASHNTTHAKRCA